MPLPLTLKLDPKQVKGVGPTSYNVLASYRVNDNHITLLVDYDLVDTIILKIDINLAIMYGHMVKHWRKGLIESYSQTAFPFGDDIFSIDGIKYDLVRDKELTQLLDKQWDVKYRSIHFVDER